LPSCHVTLCGSRPKDRAYPVELNTVGDRLRKRRLDLGLFQKEVAKQIGVTNCTIQYWENNKVSPAVRFTPRINEFLGHDPTDGDPTQSLAERLRGHRMRLGLSRKRLATLLGIDESSLAGWETGRHHPTKRSLEVIKNFLS
jgi:transcriptional regulator with XRE-family HTH domain